VARLRPFPSKTGWKHLIREKQTVAPMAFGLAQLGTFSTVRNIAA